MQANVAGFEGDHTTYASREYREERAAVIEANGGSQRISIVSLLPSAPPGQWATVSAQVRACRSPVRFLCHLFAETAIDPGDKTGPLPPITIEGFLGSGWSAIDPWVLLPAAGAWIRSPVSVRSATRYLDEALLWRRSLGGRTGERGQERVPHADALAPFVPHGRIPNRRLVERFLTEARSLLAIAPTA